MKQSTASSSEKEMAAQEAAELARIDEQIQRCRDKQRRTMCPNYQQSQSAILLDRSLARELQTTLERLSAKRADVRRYFVGLRAKAACAGAAVEKDDDDEDDDDEQRERKDSERKNRSDEPGKRQRRVWNALSREPESRNVPAKAVEKARRG
jgi:hypothetical protein